MASASLLAPSAAAPPAGAVIPIHTVRLSGPTVSLGEQGEDVKLVQRHLRIAVDGRFGPRTRRAVQTLQTRVGLEPDGVVGPLTWTALGGGGVGPGQSGQRVALGPTRRPELSLGASGPAVSDAQRLLTPHGFRVNVDGRFGPDTSATVVAFQRRRGLPTDGVIGPRTWTALSTATSVTSPQLQPAGAASGIWRTIGSRSYVVRSGDSWISIAAAKGSTPAGLAAANRMALTRRPPAGARLQVPGLWRCPVPTGKFINDYGFPRPAGRVHQGNDLFATRGTPIRAPVSGRVEQFPNPLGGNAVQLHGEDGHRYYFAHLDRYAQVGVVTAGGIIGYVGNSGSAITTPPHLHLEVHPNGGVAINPYPTITLACRS